MLYFGPVQIVSFLFLLKLLLSYGHFKYSFLELHKINDFFVAIWVAVAETL